MSKLNCYEDYCLKVHYELISRALQVFIFETSSFIFLHTSLFCSLPRSLEAFIRSLWLLGFMELEHALDDLDELIRSDWHCYEQLVT